MCNIILDIKKRIIYNYPNVFSDEYVIYKNPSFSLCSKYISEIGPKCGGIGICMSDNPYDSKWNIDVKIKTGSINRRFIKHLH